MKLILTLGLIAASFNASAALTTENCKDIGQLANTIVKNRYAGVPMSKAYSLAESSDPIIQPLMKLMVEQAYDMPKYSSQEYRNQQAQDYDDAMFAICVKNK